MEPNKKDGLQIQRTNLKTSFSALNEYASEIGLPSDFSDLFQHKKNFNPDQKWLGLTFDSLDFSRQSFHRTEADLCKFTNCSFVNVAATGNKWRNCEFENCDFSESNFDMVDFTKSTFRNCSLPADHHLNVINSASAGDDIAPLKRTASKNHANGASFSSCIFRSCTLIEMEIRGTSLTHCDFTDAELINCTIDSCTLEGAIFKKAKINDLLLQDLNVEYSDFSNATLKNVVFSLFQFPYIFGISLKQIREGDIKIGTYSGNSARNFIPWKTLESKLIPQLKSYFREAREHFPVLNLLLMEHQHRLFLEQSKLKKGPEHALAVFENYSQDVLRLFDEAVNNALYSHDYRKIKYLCKLGSHYNALPANLYKTFVESIENRAIQSNDPFILNQYKIHEGEIRSYMLRQSVFDIKIELEFIPLTLDSVNAIQTTFDQFIPSLGYTYSYELNGLTQNSPIKLFLKFAGIGNLKNLKLPKGKDALVFVLVVERLFGFSGNIASISGYNLKDFWNNAVDNHRMEKIQPNIQCINCIITQGGQILLKLEEGKETTYHLENLNEPEEAEQTESAEI